MSDIREIVELFAPKFVDLWDQPFWVCLLHVPPGADLEVEPCWEFWVGTGFESWYPRDDCYAIFVVASATAFLPEVRRHRGGRGGRGRGRVAHDRSRGRFVCAVTDTGEAYAVLIGTGGTRIRGVPTGGRLVDALRSKFGLPPGPATGTTRSGYRGDK